MQHKSTSLMLYNRNTISRYVPNTHAVYFLRGIADDNSLYPIYYIGKSSNGKLREHLLKKFSEEYHPEIVYINYIKFKSDREAQQFIKQEIARHKPQFNLEKKVFQPFFQTVSYVQNTKF